jgi:predicted ATPase
VRARSATPRRRATREAGRDLATSPRLTVVAGANGAGKSTYTAYLRKHGASIIDPDVLAVQSSMSD